MAEYYAQENPKWLSWTDGTNPMDNWMPNAGAIRSLVLLLFVKIILSHLF